MELFNNTTHDFVRVSFGFNESCSIEGGTVKEIHKLMMDIFSNIKINKTISYKDVSPLKRPTSYCSLRVQIRKEGSSFKNFKGESKSKSLYGLEGKEAKEIFLKHFELLKSQQRHNLSIKKFVAPNNLIRIQFGFDQSVSFIDTTVDKVFRIATKLFSETKIEFVAKASEAPEKLGVYVRSEEGSYSKVGRVNGSKSLTIYGLTSLEAKEVFLNNYQKYL